MIVWFNEDKETDWAVFGGTNGDETYPQRPHELQGVQGVPWRSAEPGSDFQQPGRPAPLDRQIVQGCAGET